MSSAIMSLIISHLLTFIESELIKSEPKMIAALVHDIQSLISKLELMIQTKSPAVASVLAPVLNSVQNITDSAIEAAGQSLAQNA